jgi:hypothetical protein
MLKRHKETFFYLPTKILRTMNTIKNISSSEKLSLKHSNSIKGGGKTPVKTGTVGTSTYGLLTIKK